MLCRNSRVVMQSDVKFIWCEFRIIFIFRWILTSRKLIFVRHCISRPPNGVFVCATRAIVRLWHRSKCQATTINRNGNALNALRTRNNINKLIWFYKRVHYKCFEFISRLWFISFHSVDEIIGEHQRAVCVFARMPNAILSSGSVCRLPNNMPTTYDNLLPRRGKKNHCK